jgi:hypothetical protein
VLREQSEQMRTGLLVRPGLHLRVDRCEHLSESLLGSSRAVTTLLTSHRGTAPDTNAQPHR